MKTHSFTCNLGILISSLALAAPGAVAKEKRDAAHNGEYRPTIKPANFTHVITNPYFPLVPGTVFTCIEKEGRETREVKTTGTHDTKKIIGVKCVVVRDTVTLDGVVIEDTYDGYAQDKQGAVWNFGEATNEFKSGGRVITEGSWEAGVNGYPGIMMPANPKPGKPYKQEYSPNNAGDMGQVVAVGETATVPAGTYKDCVKAKEWSMLESGHGFKWFAKGAGFVRGESSSGEVATLISIAKQ